MGSSSNGSRHPRVIFLKGLLAELKAAQRKLIKGMLAMPEEDPRRPDQMTKLETALTKIEETVQELDLLERGMPLMRKPETVQ